MVEVLIGNGDGSFQPLKSANLSGNKTIGQGLRVIATGDLNGDGYLDIVALSLTQTNSPTFDVFLGNGDGTFRRPITYATSRYTESVSSAPVGVFDSVLEDNGI